MSERTKQGRAQSVTGASVRQPSVQRIRPMCLRFGFGKANLGFGRRCVICGFARQSSLPNLMKDHPRQSTHSHTNSIESSTPGGPDTKPKRKKKNQSRRWVENCQGGMSHRSPKGVERKRSNILHHRRLQRDCGADRNVIAEKGSTEMTGAATSTCHFFFFIPVFFF